MDVPRWTTDLPGRILGGFLPVLFLHLCLLWGPGVEAECMVRLYYNLSSATPSFVDQKCDVACCGHYPNVYCCDQCDSAFRNADGHLSSGAVTGIVLGVLIGLVTLFVIFVYVYGRWRRDKDPVGRAMYRLYRMSTRRRRRPRLQTDQNGQTGQTSTDGPSTISLSNGGTQNRGFSEGRGNYPRSRRRGPGTSETAMHTEELSKPPRSGHHDTSEGIPAHSRRDQVQADTTHKYGQSSSPGVQPSAPAVMELDSRNLDKQTNNGYKPHPAGGKAQRHEPETYIPTNHQHQSHPDGTKPYQGQSDKNYQALGPRVDEHPYTTPNGVDPRDRYGMPSDHREKQNLKSESRQGPLSQTPRYSGENKTSYSPDGQPLHSSDRTAAYQSERQTPHRPNRDISQPPHPSDRNTSHPSDRNTSHPSDRNTSHPSDRNTSHPSDRNTSYPSDRHTSHPPDRNTSYPPDRHKPHSPDQQTSHPGGKINISAPNWSDPPPSYPSTNGSRGGPGYAPYSSNPGRGAPSRQPEYKETPNRQRERNYRDNGGVNLGYAGGSRQSQI